MKIDFTNISIIAAALSPLFVLIGAFVYEQRSRKRIEKPPQDQKLLRPPGHSLSIRFDETFEKILNNLLIIILISTITGSFAIVFAKWLALSAPLFMVIPCGVFLSAFAFLEITYALRVFNGYKEVRNIRLGLRGEQAVAEALQEVADCGFRTFHDFPGGEDWNIDHVTVGPCGIFVIETKARRRRGSKNGQAEHVVIYEAETLQFPAGKDRETIPQAIRNAKHLSTYLTKKTGEPVKAEPLVVLPGWFVKNSKDVSPVRVMNAAYLAKYLRNESEKIELAQVRRIIAQLDEKCRDVEF